MSSSIECPDDETLAAYFADGLDEHARDALKQHLSHCDRCRALSLVANTFTFDSGTHRRSSPPVAAGLVLNGKYRLLYPIGQGGMGTVFAAEHIRLKTRLAVKLLRSELQNRKSALERFKREAQVCASSGHPNIVKVFDFDETEDGIPFLTMELLRGESLADLIARTGALDIPLVVHILKQAASALMWAHDEGILHRDIKPSNIFLCTPLPGEWPKVVVLDFGISKIQGPDDQSLTLSREIIGTPAYLSPEMAEGNDGEVDARSDLFSLGAVAYQALTGQRPFDADSVPAMLYRVVHSEPAPVQKKREGVPESLTSLTMRLLKKKKRDRPESAREVLDALQTMSLGRTERNINVRSLVAFITLATIGSALYFAFERGHTAQKLPLPPAAPISPPHAKSTQSANPKPTVETLEKKIPPHENGPAVAQIHKGEHQKPAMRRPKHSPEVKHKHLSEKQAKEPATSSTPDLDPLL